MYVRNLSLTDRAMVVLKHVRARFRPREGDVFALVYMSSFKEPDGRMVAGFRPGYAAGPWPSGNIGSSWIIAQPLDAPDFHLMPLFKWNPEERYVMDVASAAYATFSFDRERRSQS